MALTLSFWGTNVVIVILIRVYLGVVFLGLPLGSPDASPLVIRLGLRRTAKQCSAHGVSSDRSCRNHWHFTIHVEAKKLHQLELGRGCLVAQICSNITKIVKDAGDQRHGNHGRPRAVLDNRLRLALLHTILEKIQSLHVG